MYTVFETNDRVDDTYLYRLLKTETYRHIFEVRTSGTVNRRGALRWSEFAKIRIPLPNLEEQNRIADMLRHAECELAGYEKYRELLESQKRGLMQQLLTGQVRVNIEKANGDASF